MLYRGTLKSVLGIVAAACLQHATSWAATAPTALTAPAQLEPMQIRPVPERDQNLSGREGRSQAGNPLWAIPLNALSATRERPLFSASRRPPSQAIAAAPPVPAASPPPPVARDQPQLDLLGTIVGDRQSIAVFADPATKRVVRLKIGEGDGGWTLRAVQERTAVMEKGSKQATLTLPARNGANLPGPPTSGNFAASQPASPSPVTPAPPPAQQAGPSDGESVHGRHGAPDLTAVTNGRGETPQSGTGTWRDGDGQLISPPTPPSADAAANDDTPRSAWTDGDGQRTVPPPSSKAARTKTDQVTAEGSLRPPPAAWRDGDGQVVNPPSERPQHGAGTWIDGDGQFAPAPLR